MDEEKLLKAKNIYWHTEDIPPDKSNKTETLKFNYKGETVTISEMAKRTGLKKATIHSRLFLGWDFEKAVETASSKGRNYKIYNYKGNKVTIDDLAKIAGINKSTIKYRLSHGWSIEKAITTPVQQKEI